MLLRKLFVTSRSSGVTKNMQTAYPGLATFRSVARPGSFFTSRWVLSPDPLLCAAARPRLCSLSQKQMRVVSKSDGGRDPEPRFHYTARAWSYAAAFIGHTHTHPKYCVLSSFTIFLCFYLFVCLLIKGILCHFSA